jgi:hypothetical protein
LLPILLAATLLFPNIKGRNLNTQDLILPGDLSGEARLLVIAFKREQQQLVETWLPFLKELESRQPAFRYYELPVLPGGLKLIRGIIDGGMSRGITDSVARERTITIYTDTEEFRANLGIPSNETIQLLLLDSAGYVRFRTDGAMADKKAGQLRQAVETLLNNSER